MTNTVGSTSPRDLYENAKNLDYLLNGQNPFYPDRFGRMKESWSGMQAEFRAAQNGRQAQFDAFLMASGYQSLGTYAAGISITAHNQYVIYNGLPYSLSASTAIPYTTTGDWASESSKFILRGDDVLRQDLANTADPSKGAALIAGVGRIASTISALRAMSAGNSKSALVLGYSTAGDGGSGNFYRDTTDTTSADNGITTIVGADGTRWKLEHDGHVDLYQAGCVADGATDNTAKIQALINLAIATDGFEIIVPLVGPGKSFRATSTLTINAGVRIRGEGCEPHSVVNGSGQNTRGQGSWLFFDHTGIGFTITASSSLDSTSAATGVRFSGIGTVRRHTLVTGATTTFSPTQADFDFDINNADVSIEDVTMLNPYKGIRLVNGSFGRLTIRGLRGQPLSRGIVIEESYDTCRVIDVQFWPFWSHDQRVWNYTLANLRSYVSMRNDNPFYQNIFSIFHYIGFNILGTTAGTTNKAKIFGADIDRGVYGFVQDESSSGASALFIGFSAQGETGVSEENSGILTSGTNGEFTFESPDLRVYNANCIRVYGTGNSVVINNPKLATFNQANSNFPAIEAGPDNRVDVTGYPRIGDTNGGAYYGGVGILRAPGESGSTTATTSAAGQVIVQHGAGFTPKRVFISMTGGGDGATSQVITKTDTSFTVNFFIGATALVNSSVSFDWEVKF
ncbi:hypothetical protein IQ22_02826 [Pseudomonas duriflava]|uniref:Pectate lyase-like protein n=1 Tax=Pseudomonas duriflava TaxID=459528 RepID=A0A562Q8A1_9PSED|nr:hypothetical protein [Pseudomonas duriflava]TWI52991.1 hypothetical protein IQ22_02826 [Pseudomonas duriflava]